MATILSPFGLYGGNRKTKLPLKPNTRIHAPRGTLGIFVFAPSNGCPATANLLSLDTSLAIPTRVLCFEVSGLRCRTPVRLVLTTGQTSTHRSDRFDAAASGLRPWLCGSTKEPSGFLVNHWKPRELGVVSANHHS
jgi:hypothetical protein